MAFRYGSTFQSFLGCSKWREKHLRNVAQVEELLLENQETNYVLISGLLHQPLPKENHETRAKWRKVIIEMVDRFLGGRRWLDSLFLPKVNKESMLSQTKGRRFKMKNNCDSARIYARNVLINCRRIGMWVCTWWRESPDKVEPANLQLCSFRTRLVICRISTALEDGEITSKQESKTSSIEKTFGDATFDWMCDCITRNKKKAHEEIPWHNSSMNTDESINNDFEQHKHLWRWVQWNCWN